ncbi:SgcJ/EcaC family oxidoreductase [Pseudomonas sp. L7]|uniref:SgcJ/EcaC family oxidoreductase n=1 Tax=Pseudomonas sp. L7 TaxID=3388343 RepID=UPI003985503F
MNKLTYWLPLVLLGSLSLHAHAAPQPCQQLDEKQALALFERWNDSLRSGDPQQVAKLYENDAVLLPTVSKAPRLTTVERLDYFKHFLADQPSGKLDTHHLSQTCNKATLAGLYTFDFAKTGQQVAARYTFTYRWDGQQWLIHHHHSSLLPTT